MYRYTPSGILRWRLVSENQASGIEVYHLLPKEPTKKCHSALARFYHAPIEASLLLQFCTCVFSAHAVPGSILYQRLKILANSQSEAVNAQRDFCRQPKVQGERSVKAAAGLGGLVFGAFFICLVLSAWVMIFNDGLLVSQEPSWSLVIMFLVYFYVEI